MVMTPEQRTTALFDAHRGLVRKLEGILWFSRRSADSRKASKLLLAIEQEAGAAISEDERQCLAQACRILTSVADAHQTAAKTVRRYLDESGA